MPGQLTPAGLRKQIRSGRLEPLYLLEGADEVGKAALVTEIAETLDESLRGFNVQRCYGGEVSMGALLDAARTLPFAAPRRVVVLVQAERLLEPRRESAAGEAALADFERYLKAPPDRTTLILATGGARDKRRRVWSLLDRYASVIECGSVAAAEAERWVKAEADRLAIRIDSKAVRMIVQRAGSDMARLRADVERVLLYASDQPVVTADDVAAVVGPAVSQDDWALTNAIERGSAAVALRELALALDAGVAPLRILGQLAWLVRKKLPPPRVAAGVEAVFRTDVGLKTSAGNPRILLERLVTELCGGG